MKYCRRCLQPDTRPDIKFNEDSICNACLYEDFKKQIDWEKREKDLHAIAAWAKANVNTYDCVVGVSGGKDSTFQAIYAKEKLGLNPLLVNCAPDNITEVGRHNLENLVQWGFDMISLRPNPRIMRKLTRRAFYEFGNPIKPSEYPLYASAYIIADKFDIPLIIQGENAALTQSGNFLIDQPQKLTLVQGDGKKAEITLFGTDTIESVVQKLNDAIANQLGQAALTGIGATHSDKFVSFVTEGGKQDSGLETVAGTFVIRSAITGDAGEITFIGDENIIKALSLTNLKDAVNNQFTVTVTDAHTGDYVAKDVKIEGNVLVGTVHENVDVEFDNMTGIIVEWDTATKDFKITGGFGNRDKTYVHIADNTMVFQIGANPLQDVGAAIGDMRARALGVHNILVTDREHASDAITKIDSAIQRVSSERSKMGALQNRLEHTINNLGVAAENLTSAESRIRDLDFAKEMMAFTKNQIMLQAGTAMLAQANAKPQSVLQLLG